MRRDRLLAEVRSYLPGIFDGDLCEVVADTGGEGLCRHAPDELIERMGRGRPIYFDFDNGKAGADDGVWPYVEKFPLPRWTRCYWPPRGIIADSGHVVAAIDGYYVDLTAQQFRRRLPFPLVVSTRTP